MESRPGRIDYRLTKDRGLVGKPSASSTVTESKTEKQFNLTSKTGNVNQSTGSEAYNPEEQAPGAALAMLSKGNINRGIGAGAFNEGKKSGAVNEHDGVINFSKSTKEDSESSARSGGNTNIGIGAGAYNKGEMTGAINGGTGALNF